MKRGQQTCKEPKCRQCALITGNRNVSGLMSVCLYLEMKMHLCCPDPIFLSISEQKCDTHVCMHTHAHTQQTLRVLLPNRKSYQRNEPPGCVNLEKGRGANRHLPLGRVHGELCDEVLCLCLWVDVIHHAHVPLETKVHSFWPTWKTPHPPAPFHS